MELNQSNQLFKQLYDEVSSELTQLHEELNKQKEMLACPLALNYETT